MKTKIYLTMFVILMSVEIVVAQQIVYGDQNQTNITENICEDGCDLASSESAPLYYNVDEIVPNAFTTGNNILVVCRLLPNGSESNIVCSTNSPEKGWGTMVLSEDDASFSYDEKSHNDGANIFSIVFTDPDNGWAVGELENNTINSGVLFHTTDGGLTWNLQFKSGTPMKLDAIGFTDALNGWAKGVRMVSDVTFEIMLHTTDGGETWNEQTLAQLNYSDSH